MTYDLDDRLYPTFFFAIGSEKHFVDNRTPAFREHSITIGFLKSFSLRYRYMSLHPLANPYEDYLKRISLGYGLDCGIKRVSGVYNILRPFLSVVLRWGGIGAYLDIGPKFELNAPTRFHAVTYS